LAQAFGGPAYQSLIPSLVDKKDLPNAVALNSIQFNVARVLGPSQQSERHGVETVLVAGDQLGEGLAVPVAGPLQQPLVVHHPTIRGGGAPGSHGPRHSIVPYDSRK